MIEKIDDRIDIYGYIKDQNIQHEVFEHLNLEEQEKLIKIIEKLILKEEYDKEKFFVYIVVIGCNKWLWVFDGSPENKWPQYSISYNRL